MIRIIAKLFAVAAVLTICLPVQPSSAENVAFVSASGSGTACTQTAPCGQIVVATQSLAGAGGRIVCLTPVSEAGGFSFGTGAAPWVFDCPNAVMHGQITIDGNAVLKFQHMSFSPGLMLVTSGGAGTLIYEDCVLEDAAGTALDIEPTAFFNLVMKNSRISNNSAGVLLKPGSGGIVTATFDGVTITGNMGGGVKADTTNGPVTVDISNSTITNNAGNGLNAASGSSGQNNLLNISHTVIAKNGSAGVQVNGANSAALIDTTLLDSNGAATAALNGGRILTYGNNRIVGAPGSGFTSTTPLQ